MLQCQDEKVKKIPKLELHNTVFEVLWTKSCFLTKKKAAIWKKSDEYLYDWRKETTIIKTSNSVGKFCSNRLFTSVSFSLGIDECIVQYSVIVSVLVSIISQPWIRWACRVKIHPSYTHYCIEIDLRVNDTHMCDKAALISNDWSYLRVAFKTKKLQILVKTWQTPASA